ncbi:RsmD family RNA methyltransferase [Robiginitalea biformata]|uniref:Putative methyltransferase n=1 Tax=Robiginitalea biformata (strain ATCC BAA-864 / DSM 15991 / KCTC 12146 / HTCC2501) TaxID=313596 RepID=A4CK18_ROBBH|nr:RsmD family RNA methyltransferase [Robiginitalea biformata]EAR15217.1 putative methyltransferase [Robiginitalea biformata HTCC2501]
MIRIISGTHRGRRIRAPRKLPVRPTTDRAKEALFNILAAEMDWPRAHVLDLYAGTGNISYESASRGGETITAVDADAGCVAFIRKTAAELDMPIHAVRSDCLAYLRQTALKFDLVFGDPPYDMNPGELEELVQEVMDRQLLAPEGLLILEHTRETDLSHLDAFEQARRYGGTVFSFFRGI